jgi:uncharacterized protein
VTVLFPLTFARNELETTTGFVTVRLRATSLGEGRRRELDFRRGPDGSWTATTEEQGHLELPPAGGNTASLASAVDCNLGLSPVTNMMPILRHGLLDSGGPIDFHDGLERRSGTRGTAG